MKKLALILIFPVIVFFTGCGGGGGSSSESNIEEDTFNITGQATLGPLSKANIFLMDINGSLLAETVANDSLDSLEEAGKFDIKIKTSNLPDIFIVAAKGGKDIDPTDNGNIVNIVENNGTIHAILTIDDLQLDGLKINPLTEIIYQDVINTYGNTLATLTKTDLKSFLDTEAKTYLNDTNATYSDILTFNPKLDKEKSKIDWSKVLTLLISGIHSGESSSVINKRVISLKAWLKDEGVYTNDENTSIKYIHNNSNGERVITTITKADDNTSVSTFNQILTTDTGEIISIYASKVNDTESYLRASVQKQGHEFSIEGKTTLLQGLSFDTNTIANFVSSLIKITDSNTTSLQISIDKQLTSQISDHEVIFKIDGREPTAEELQIIADDPEILWNTESTKELAEQYGKYSFVKDGHSFTLYIQGGTGVAVLEIDESYYKQMMGIIDYSKGITLNNIKDTTLTLLGVIETDGVLSVGQKAMEKIGATTISKFLGFASIITDLHFIASGGVSKAAIKLGAAHTITYLMGMEDTDIIYENEPYYPIIFYKPQNLSSETIYLNIYEYQYPDINLTSFTGASINPLIKTVPPKTIALCKIAPKADKAYIIFPGEIVIKKELKDYPIYDLYNNYIGKVISIIELKANDGILSGIIEQSNTYKINDARTIYTNFTYSTANNQLTLDASSSIASDGSITSYVWKNALGTTIAIGEKPYPISFSNLIVNNGWTSITLETKSAGYTGKKTKMIRLCKENEIYKDGTCVQAIVKDGIVYGTVTSPVTGRIWLDRNLGAKRVCQSLTDKECYGDYFEWGRNADGHEKSNSPTTYSQATSIDNAGNKFIIAGIDTGNNDWLLNDENGAKRLVNWNKTDGRICPKGFKVPTKEELEKEIEFIDFEPNQPLSFLKLPYAGWRQADTGKLSGQGKFGILMLNSIDKKSELMNYGLRYENGSIRLGISNPIGGASIRCIKDKGTGEKPINTKAKIVLDTKRNIMWQKKDDGKKYTYDEAKQYCENLTLGGYNDWHLPSVIFLDDIIDESRSPAIHPLFINTKKDYYWSSTVVSNYEGVRLINIVNFKDGSHTLQSSIAKHYVRCIREY